MRIKLHICLQNRVINSKSQTQMNGKLSAKVDQYRRLRFNELDPRVFENFFLHFLNSGVTLTVSHHGRERTRKIISAATYAAGSGRKDFGIDLRAEVEGGEIWVFQCKRVNKWSDSQTKIAIEKARQFHAHHYFLVVACDPQQPVYDEIAKHGDWTLWSLDLICDLIRRNKLQGLGDVSAESFRREVFRAFEAENLRHVSEVGRPLWQNLLRLIALLAPVKDPVALAENARRPNNWQFSLASAAKAAEAHAADPVLGPFYRWIIKIEQRISLRVEVIHAL